MDIKEFLLLWFINFLIKCLLHLQINIKQLVVLIRYKMSNQLKNYKSQLLGTLKKDSKIIFGGADLTDMQSISQLKKGFRFLLCVVDIFSKYAWVVPLKDKNSVSIVNAFQKALDKSDHKQDMGRQRK